MARSSWSAGLLTGAIAVVALALVGGGTALAATGRSDGPPPELFGYRQPGDSLASAGETHPTSVRVEAPGEPAEQWNFDAGTDRWVQTAGGPRVAVANLVVQIVSFKTVYLSRKYGETVPVRQPAAAVGPGPRAAGPSPASRRSPITSTRPASP